MDDEDANLALGVPMYPMRSENTPLSGTPPISLTGSKSMLRGKRRLYKLWSAKWTIVLLALAVLVYTNAKLTTLTGHHDSTTMMVTDMKTGNLHLPGESVEKEQKSASPYENQVGKLDVSLLPSRSLLASNKHARRLVFVGDIHGCLDELLMLLAKLEYKEGSDHIIATGDIVNKGPNSRGVLDFLIAHGASCVRGNHDDHIMTKSTRIPSLTEEELQSEDAEFHLAMSLTDRQLRYLQSCPLILDVGDIPNRGRFVVVHGGLVPSIELTEQSPWAVMNMRVINPLTHEISKDHDKNHFIPWANLWNQYQEHHLTGRLMASASEKEMLNTYHSTTVVYGHDAKRGLQISKFTKGLDSGCVKGRQLTALVIGIDPEEEIFQVGCQRYV